MNTHICLVSQQAAPNLLPALDPALKPQKAVLIITDKMRRQAEYLAAVLKESGIAVEQLHLADEQNLPQMQDELTELASRLDGQRATLNITGGTKLMSVAAQSVADVAGWDMFYVDVDTDHIIWLGKPGHASRPPAALAQQLRLSHYLRSYGYTLADKPQRPTPGKVQQEVTQFLATHAGSLQDAITTLNALAQQAENQDHLSVQMTPWQSDSRSLDVLLREFEKAGALSVQGDRITFTSRADRDFVKGGWLELHAFNAVNIVTGPLGIRDKAVNLEVLNDTSRTKHELDIAFMARNRLFVIECKTARIDKPQGNGGQISAPKANDTLFKLAANCNNIGGLGARGMLVSYRKLREAELQLARALGIAVVAGNEIARLPERLKAWVAPGT